MAASMGDWQRINPRTYEKTINLPDHWIAFVVVASLMANKQWYLYINFVYMTNTPTFEALEDMVPIMINAYTRRP